MGCGKSKDGPKGAADEVSFIDGDGQKIMYFAKNKKLYKNVDGGGEKEVTELNTAGVPPEKKGPLKDLAAKCGVKEAAAAAAPAAAAAGPKPILYYMPIAGRGEITRMLAKLGGVDLEDKQALDHPLKLDLKSYGSPSGLPVFEHGPMKLSQSHSVVSYMLNTSPKFSKLTPAQKAKDLQFNAIMDDVMSGLAPILLNDKDKDPEKLKGVISKWFPIIEHIVPEAGFVNGLDFPTAADYAILMMSYAQMPFCASYAESGCDPNADYPKFKALADRTAAVPEVAQYVKESGTFKGNPMGMKELAAIPPKEGSTAAGKGERPEPSGKPILHYMPIAGRGEITRMIFNTGGVEFENHLTDGKDIELKDFGSPSSTPVFEHGPFKLSQSHAIVHYALSITDKYKKMTPAQIAKDLQINAIMDDFMTGHAVIIFFDQSPDEEKGPKHVAVTDKWMPILEGILPDKGFVNGLSFPTAADFCCVEMARGVMPFLVGRKVGGIELGEKYPKFNGIVERTVAVPEVKKHLEESQTMAGDPLGIMGGSE